MTKVSWVTQFDIQEQGNSEGCKNLIVKQESEWGCLPLASSVRVKIVFSSEWHTDVPLD